MRRKGLKTKENITKVALKLFHKHGVHWVSFHQIAEKVGVSQAALYKYFKDKDELIKACALMAVENGRKIIDAHIDPHASAGKQIYAYLEGNLKWLKENPQEGAILLALFYFSYNNPETQRLMLGIYQQSIERLAVRLSAGIREKAWQVSDIFSTARIIHNIFLGEMLKAIHTPNEFEIKARTDLLWAGVQKLLS